jgi:hypothetical protein
MTLEYLFVVVVFALFLCLAEIWFGCQVVRLIELK